ncbi:hypothetical protein FIBSPDRAFT_892061 [Athelia psychrophila]|uniref:Uncharacterized protein n=1 Tax=Athelia psychrophila TaxID=1759441 RepID=A0A166IZJ9_9AGAM|nr:hypothetical protein FIBSPDRAFT_892061 [Fibularhizoctonia sp. CBS 109695]
MSGSLGDSDVRRLGASGRENQQTGQQYCTAQTVNITSASCSFLVYSEPSSKALSSTSRFTRKAALHLVWRDIQIWPTGSGNTDPTRPVLEAVRFFFGRKELCHHIRSLRLSCEDIGLREKPQSRLNKEDMRDLTNIADARGFPQTFILQWGSEAVVVLLLDCMPRLKKLKIPGYQASSSLLSLSLRNIVSPPSCFLTIQHLTFTPYTSIQTAKAWLLLSSLKTFVLEAIDGEENEDEEENTTVDMVKLEGSKDDAQVLVHPAGVTHITLKECFLAGTSLRSFLCSTDILGYFECCWTRDSVHRYSPIGVAQIWKGLGHQMDALVSLKITCEDYIADRMDDDPAGIEASLGSLSSFTKLEDLVIPVRFLLGRSPDDPPISARSSIFSLLPPSLRRFELFIDIDWRLPVFLSAVSLSPSNWRGDALLKCPALHSFTLWVTEYDGDFNFTEFRSSGIIVRGRNRRVLLP